MGVPHAGDGGDVVDGSSVQANKKCGNWAREDLPTAGILTVMDCRGICCGIYGVETVGSEATAEVLVLIKLRYINQGLQVKINLQ